MADSLARLAGVFSISQVEQQISTTINQQETGGGTTGVGVSLNNTGGLKYATWEAAYGATPDTSGFAKFPTLEKGKAAVLARVDQLVQAGHSLASLIATWSPASDNNTNNPQRVAQLAQATSLDPQLPIKAQAQGIQDTNPELPGYMSPDQYYATQTVQGQQDSNPNSPLSQYAARIAAFAVGIILVIMGLVLMKQTQIVIENVKGAAGKVAGAAAVAA